MDFDLPVLQDDLLRDRTRVFHEFLIDEVGARMMKPDMT